VRRLSYPCNKQKTLKTAQTPLKTVEEGLLTKSAFPAVDGPIALLKPVKTGSVSNVVISGDVGFGESNGLPFRYADRCRLPRSAAWDIV
jgi:hypothetical protein